MKEDTLKAKLAKTIEKKELAKKYDEYTQEKEKEQEIKKEVKPAKKEKKVVYKLADSSEFHHLLHQMMRMKGCLCKENKR